MSLLTDIGALLHKVEMSQICLADMMCDCKTDAEVQIRAQYQAKYEFMHELENDLREWKERIRDYVIHI